MSRVIAIVDYGMGNLGSMLNMCKKIGAKAVVTSDPGQIAEAERLILPGVGAFDSGMKNLRERGLDETLNRAVLGEGRMILGVCLGLQLFTRSSEEGVEAGLGWLEAQTVRFNWSSCAASPGPIPHMGWNTLEIVTPHPLFAGLEEEARFYFVHSYHAKADSEEGVVGWTSYGYPFASAMVRGSIIGVQFHPEKSHRYGMRILTNFAEMPAC